MGTHCWRTWERLNTSSVAIGLGNSGLIMLYVQMGIQLLIDSILNRTALLPILCTFWQGTCKSVFQHTSAPIQHKLHIKCSASYCNQKKKEAIRRRRSGEESRERLQACNQLRIQNLPQFIPFYNQERKEGKQRHWHSSNEIQNIFISEQKIKYSLVKALLHFAHAWHLRSKIKWRTGVFMSSRNSAEAFLTSYTVWFILLFLQSVSSRVSQKTGAPKHGAKVKRGK